jgi:lipoprotein NlpD
MNNLPGSMSKYLLIFLSALTLVITVGCSTPRTKPANVIDRSGNSAESTPPGYYRVKRGDTLTRIALDHGQAPKDLVTWN